MKSIQIIVDRSGRSFDRLAIGERHRLGYWPVDLTAKTDLFQVVTKDLNITRLLADVLAADALLEHQRGNDFAALKRIEQIRFMSAVLWVTTRRWLVVWWALAAGRGRWPRITEIAPDLKIGSQPGDACRQKRFVASSTAFWMMMRARQAYVRDMRGERMVNLLILGNMLGGYATASAQPGQPASQGWNPMTQYAMGPIVHYNARLIIDFEEQLMHQVDQPNLPAAETLSPKVITSSGMLTMFAQILTPSFSRTIQTHFRTLVDQHLAATSLAMRWYALEHNGQFPPTLDVLVPRYLPKIPIDVLTADSHPIRYLARAQNPAIYSVGENGVDDGGSAEASRPNLAWQSTIGIGSHARSHSLPDVRQLAPATAEKLNAD